MHANSSGHSGPDDEFTAVSDEWSRDLKSVQVQKQRACRGKSYDEPERAKWNDSEKRSFNGSWGKQPFGEKKSDNFSSRKNFDKGQVTEIKKFACFTCGSDKHFKRDYPKNKEVDNKRFNVNKVSTEGTELVDGTVAARVDVLGIFGPAVKCPLVYVPIGLATGGQVNVVHQQVLCALAEVLVEDVLLPPDVLDMLGGAQSEENSLAQSSQDLRVDSGNVDETEVSSCILPEKAQEHIEDSQRNITSCRNEVGTLGTKDEEVTAEMDKGIMVADSFRSEQECCAELALVWKYAKEGKGNYYEVDGYLFRRDKILGESIGQLVIPKCRRTEVLKLAHTSVFSSHMGPKKTLERIKYSFFWEGLRADVKKFCESCKECQLTRSVRIKDRSSSTPVARPELPFEVGRVRNSCLHLATGRTRDDIEKRIWQRRREKKVGTEEKGGGEKPGVVKSRHGWTMYLNLVTSQYILYFKKCPIEVLAVFVRWSGVEVRREGANSGLVLVTRPWLKITSGYARAGVVESRVRSLVSLKNCHVKSALAQKKSPHVNIQVSSYWNMVQNFEPSVAMVTNSWPPCRDLNPGATEDFTSKGVLKDKSPLVGMVW
ncbi:CCHC-type domain-containing protein [Trichonephila clavipes]|nr:CCHC-type domain-containing protein [Trichonephila clavipes]